MDNKIKNDKCIPNNKQNRVCFSVALINLYNLAMP